MVKQLASDISSLGIEKKVLYQTFRNGGDGYWADVPANYALHLPAGSLLLLENEQVYQLIKIKDQQLIVALQEQETKEKIIDVSQIDAHLKCFIFKKQVKSESLNFSLEDGIGVAAMLLVIFPSFLFLALTDFNTITLSASIPIVLSVLLMILLGVSFNSKTFLTSFFCRHETSNNCSDLSSVNPFRFALFHPLVMGSTYACSNLIFLLHFENSSLLLSVQFLAIITNIYVFVFRLNHTINCRLCDTIAIFLLLTASAVVFHLIG